MMMSIVARRRGITLIELLVTVTLTSAFAMLLLDLFSQAQRIHLTCIRYQISIREVRHWTEHLRADVRAARGNATFPGAELGLVLPSGDVAVHRLDGERVVREVHRREEIVHSEVLIRNAAKLDCAFERKPGRPTLVRYRLELEKRSDDGRIEPVIEGVVAFREVER